MPVSKQFLDETGLLRHLDQDPFVDHKNAHQKLHSPLWISKKKSMSYLISFTLKVILWLKLRYLNRISLWEEYPLMLINMVH